MKVTIESAPDGTYLVSKDDAAAMPAGMPGEGQPMPQEGAMPQAQPKAANSLEEAMKVVVSMFREQKGGIKQSPFEQGMAEGLGAPAQGM